MAGVKVLEAAKLMDLYERKPGPRGICMQTLLVAWMEQLGRKRKELKTEK